MILQRTGTFGIVIEIPCIQSKCAVCAITNSDRVQKSLGVEVTTAIAGTLEVVVSFSGPSLTLRLSDVCLHVQLPADTATPNKEEQDEQAPMTPTGTAYTLFCQYASSASFSKPQMSSAPVET